MFLAAEHFKTIMRFLVLLTNGKYRKSLLPIMVHIFCSAKKIDFCKKITPAGDVIILLVSEMSVPVFAVGKHFPLKISFPRCGLRRK